MKKLLSIAITGMLVTALMLTSNSTHAQASSGSIKLKTTSNVDSANTVNAGVSTLFAPISVMNKKLSIQVDLKKVSGTGAGVVRLKASNTGVAGSYVRVLPTDSLIVGNTATKSYIFHVPTVDCSFWQVEYTGSGTMVVTQRATAVYGRDN